MPTSSSDLSRQERLRRLLDKAMQLPTEERRVFLQAESFGDPDLQDDIAALLLPTKEESSQIDPST